MKYINEFDHKAHLFVDMDGTLATWQQAACFEDLLQENYFRDLPPYQEVVDAIKILCKTRPELDVFTLSAYMPENPYALGEKNDWLDLYLPEIDTEHRIFVPCGVSKASAAADRFGHFCIDGTFFLLDDYSVNLHEWDKSRGRCIKLRNGINGNGGTWKGAKDLSEAMNLALEYVGMRMEPKRVTEELKRNIYYVPTIRARYACNKNVPYSQRNMQLENLADMADRYWVKNLFSYRFLYWEKQRLLGIVMMKDEDLSDKWPLCVYFQNSTDQNYPYSDWEVGNIPFFTDAVSKAKVLTLHDIASLRHDMDEESFGAESLEYQQSYCYEYIFDTLGLDAWLYGSERDNVPYKCFELNGINSDIELFRCHALLKAILEKENPV